MGIQQELNSHAITSLILGIFSIILPFIGLILGVIGIFLGRKSLQQIMQLQQVGRGIAVGGIVCSSVGLGFQLLIIISYYSATSLMESAPI